MDRREMLASMAASLPILASLEQPQAQAALSKEYPEANGLPIFQEKWLRGVSTTWRLMIPDEELKELFAGVPWEVGWIYPNPWAPLSNDVAFMAIPRRSIKVYVPPELNFTPTFTIGTMSYGVMQLSERIQGFYMNHQGEFLESESNPLRELTLVDLEETKKGSLKKDRPSVEEMAGMTPVFQEAFRQFKGRLKS